MPPSPIDTWPERLGSIRQVGSSAGRDVTTTLPRMSARWSSMRVVNFCTSPPSLLPSSPPIAPVRLPPWLAICPVTRSEPFSVVEMLRPVEAPFTTNGPRAMVQPMSALPSSSASGFSFLPVMPRGALASSASRIASAATATGATMTEVRVTGCKAGSAAVTGLLSSSGLPGKNRFSAHSVLEKKMTTTPVPITRVRTDRPNGSVRLGLTSGRRILSSASFRAIVSPSRHLPPAGPDRPPQGESSPFLRRF